MSNTGRGKLACSRALEAPRALIVQNDLYVASQVTDEFYKRADPGFDRKTFVDNVERGGGAKTQKNNAKDMTCFAKG